ncbi:MAG: hypothetical protein IKR60_00890, partial [Alphaproteobacteria bacterium]|nr:hypothetical protein [Alphaproteobacteria bacterium]
KGITELKSSVFGNINISSVVIPENVTTISPHAFTISTGASSTPLETIYCPEHLLSQCEQTVSFRTDAGLKTDILSYQKDGNRIFYNKRWYNSANDILFGDYIPKRIYTIDEANRVAGEVNRVSIKYK